MLSKSIIHVVANGKTSFLLMAELCSIIYLHEVFRIRRAGGFFLVLVTFPVPGTTRVFLKDEALPSSPVTHSPPHKHHDLCTKPQAGPQTDQGFRPVRRCEGVRLPGVRRLRLFLLKGEFTGVGPKADRRAGLWVRTGHISSWRLDSIRWTSGEMWSDIREGLLRDFTLGRQNSTFQDWESVLERAWLKGVCLTCLDVLSDGKWDLVFEFPQGMRKWILFLQISVVSIGTDFWKTLWKVKVLVAQSCPTLYDPIDCSPPGSSVHEILQARTLEWAAHSLLQEGEDLQKIFPTQGLNLGLPTLQADSLASEPLGKRLLSGLKLGAKAKAS